MGDKTEELVKAAQRSIDVLKQNIRSAETTKDYPNKRLKEVKEKNHQSWHKDIEDLLTEKMHFKNGLQLLALGVKNGKTSLANLNKKVKVKEVLNFFKTQKSLDEAKKVAKELEETIKDGEKAHKKLDGEFKTFEKEAQKVVDAIPKK